MRLLITTICLAFPFLAACSEQLPDLEQKVIDIDERNSSIIFQLSGTPSEEVTLDIADMTGEESGTDVFRVLWHTTYVLKESGHPETAMILASFGQPRYRVPGSVVSEMANDYPDQNPIYVIRTFPAKVETLDGEQAYPDHQGGWLHVSGKQMEDFSELMKQWVVQPYLAAQGVEDPEVEYRDGEAF